MYHHSLSKFQHTYHQQWLRAHNLQRIFTIAMRAQCICDFISEIGIQVLDNPEQHQQQKEKYDDLREEILLEKMKMKGQEIPISI